MLQGFNEITPETPITVYCGNTKNLVSFLQKTLPLLSNICITKFVFNCIFEDFLITFEKYSILLFLPTAVL